jgi:hypothetical protein
MKKKKSQKFYIINENWHYDVSQKEKEKKW